MRREAWAGTHAPAPHADFPVYKTQPQMARSILYKTKINNKYHRAPPPISPRYPTYVLHLSPYSLPPTPQSHDMIWLMFIIIHSFPSWQEMCGLDSSESVTESDVPRIRLRSLFLGCYLPHRLSPIILPTSWATTILLSTLCFYYYVDSHQLHFSTLVIKNKKKEKRKLSSFNYN